jgi:hypothetical protein
MLRSNENTRVEQRKMPTIERTGATARFSPSAPFLPPDGPDTALRAPVRGSKTYQN